jgi:hypothetical protein
MGDLFSESLRVSMTPEVHHADARLTGTDSVPGRDPPGSIEKAEERRDRVLTQERVGEGLPCTRGKI